MAAQDAVLVAAVARQNVRDSLARMEYHLARGARGTLGVEREVLFLDGLSREATRLGGNTQVGFKTKATQGLGARAKAALSSGSGATIGRAKSSLLATFSDETMFGARSWTYAGGQQWVWQANASACAACLANHGSRFFGSMFPEHPSCLCFPVPPDQAGHITSLSDSQLTDVLRDSNNPRFRAQAKLIDSGRLSVRDAIAGARRPSTRAFYERTLARLTEGVYGATTEVVGAATTFDVTSVAAHNADDMVGYVNKYGNRAEDMAKTLERWGVTEDEFKAIMKKGLNESDVIVTLDQRTLLQVLDDGRIKSQFETGTSSPGGFFDTKLRGEFEKRMFGYADDLAPADRPIYGWMGKADGTNFSLSTYGDVRVVMKKKVKDSTTFTVGDSLNSDLVARALTAPELDSIAWESFLQSAGDDMLKAFKSGNITDPRAAGYVEGQIHGGVATVENIAEVVFTRAPNPTVTRALDAQEIAWRILK